MSLAVETDSFDSIRHDVLQEDVIGFQIPIGLGGVDDARLVLRPISQRDLPLGNLSPG